MKKKFTRGGHAKQRSDIKGRVLIKIMLLDKSRGGHHVIKGNMIKGITLEDTKVSGVYEAIEKALFD